MRQARTARVVKCRRTVCLWSIHVAQRVRPLLRKRAVGEGSRHVPHAAELTISCPPHGRHEPDHLAPLGRIAAFDSHLGASGN